MKLGKEGKWLNVWIGEMIDKKASCTALLRVKPREIHSPITMLRKTLVYLASARWFAHFIKCYSMTGVGPTGRVGSADKEVLEEF